MDRKPLRTVRSDWTLVDDPALLEAAGARDVVAARRNTHDGLLAVIVACEPVIGWHLSISHHDHRDRPRRYPSWDEIADARDVFLPLDLAFGLILPPASEYVALHDTTFHLHEIPRPARRSDLISVAMNALAADGSTDPLRTPLADVTEARAARYVVDALIAAGHLRPTKGS